MSKKVTRLFGQFIPSHYDLTVEISQDKQTFTGSVAILGSRKGRPSQRLTFHQKGLIIHDAKVFFNDKKNSKLPVTLSRVVSHETKNEIRLHSDQTLYSGSYRVELSFSGKITRNMEGMYSCFFTEDNTEKQLIATQFESHHAREVFPCIDEPEAKATFSLTLVHDSKETAISNTPIKNQKEQACRTVTSFEPTPIMSTYLLAFVIGEMEYRETKSEKNGIQIRTYATKNQIEHTAFALEIAAKCMDFYEEYYDIPFPLAKCDFVALPDFASGAMENWGLITFREQALLYDASNTSLSSKQYVAIVVAHELTHQWFGNLVTMEWWTDLWLNEGFASWMEYLAIDHFYPEWELWTQFSVDEQQQALKLDSLEHTHAIEVAINHPDEIRTIFDVISYQKGASVIQMLYAYLGDTDFREGLRHYLKKHAYGNARTEDLWQALEDVTKKPVKTFMEGWTKQPGFPVLNVQKKQDHLTLTQKRFVANPHSEAKNDTAIWSVPLLASSLSIDTMDKSVINIPFLKQELIKINSKQTGFYRTVYDDSFIEAQQKAVLSKQLSPVDRMGLLADSFEVTKAGYQSVDKYLELLAAYAEEDNLAAWDIIASSLGSIRSLLSKSDTDNELRDAMKPFIIRICKEQSKRLGWEISDTDKHIDRLLRPTILGLQAGADEPETVAKAISLFTTVKSADDNPIHPDLRSLVYTTTARSQGEAVFDKLIDLYKTTQSSDEKLSLTAALTSFEDSKLHMKVLELSKTDLVRLQDVSYWVAYGFMNRFGRKETWQWLMENWQWLRDNLGGDLSFSRMPIYAARTFSDPAMLESYQSFFTEHMEPMLDRTYKQGLEIGSINTAWKLRDQDKALTWFKSQQ